MVRFVDTVFYLLEYSELFFFLSMFQFNWITTPLGDGSTLSNVCLAWVFFFLVLFFFFFVAVNYVMFLTSLFTGL